MSRPLMDIAEEAMQHIKQLEEALTCASVLFRALEREFPEGGSNQQIAQVGVSHCAEFIATARECWLRAFNELNDMDNDEWMSLEHWDELVSPLANPKLPEPEVRVAV